MGCEEFFKKYIFSVSRDDKNTMLMETEEQKKKRGISLLRSGNMVVVCNEIKSGPGNYPSCHTKHITEEYSSEEMKKQRKSWKGDEGISEDYIGITVNND